MPSMPSNWASSLPLVAKTVSSTSPWMWHLSASRKRVVRYDKNGDNHYDIISAFIKSMRGSDPDAAVYYLAKNALRRRRRQIHSPKNHDPRLRRHRKRRSTGPLCSSRRSPGSRTRRNARVPDHPLSGSHLHGLRPQSNSAVNAIFAAMDSVKRTKTTVPPHLQDAHYGGHEKLGHGIGYKYAHDYPNHYVHQQYLPTEIQGEHFYELSEMGYEKTLKEYQNKIKSQS